MRSRTLRYTLLSGFLALAATWFVDGDGGTGTRPAVAQSQSFTSSSPGPLTKEHASLDTDTKCNDCHVNDTKALSNDKCLGCHDHSDLKKRINAGEGYHSSAKVRGRKCETCHVEHEGRSFDIMGWRTIKGGEKGFDHSLTGWPLKDKHGVLECAECHKNKNTAGRRTYLGEDKLCGSCHQRDQPHGFDRRAMMQCERCHTEVSWKPNKQRLDFDHNDKADAEFPQEGAHSDVACGKCHPQAQFNLKRKRPGNCGNTGCHVSSHEGHLFDTKACEWCHSPKFRSLKKFDFNHKARTRFSLAGAHGKLTCYKCHTKSLATQKPNKACAQCHADDNPHKDRFAQFGKPVPACETCHPESSYQPSRFNHGSRTKFALQGKHGQIQCRKCHRGSDGGKPDGPYDWEDFRTVTNHGQKCMSATGTRTCTTASSPTSRRASRSSARTRRGARAGADLPRVPLHRRQPEDDPRGDRRHPRQGRPLAAQGRAPRRRVRQVPREQRVQGHPGAVRGEVPRGLAPPGLAG